MAAPGLPDRRPVSLPGRVARVLQGVAGEALEPAQLDAARGLAARLPGLVAALADTGLPTTLVHADFHPGNWRGGDGKVTIVDWSGAHLGNPAQDLLRLQTAVPAPLAAHAEQVWCDAWVAQCPGSDPAAALALMRPLAPLEAAATYQWFLDHIEPDEWPYHRDDPAAQVRLALAAARLSQPGGPPLLTA
jgi:Ser/Thr protein kinase RdoA (MazF antagonist)